MLLFIIHIRLIDTYIIGKFRFTSMMNMAVFMNMRYNISDLKCSLTPSA